MTQLGKYDILEELGRGGFGIVYKARDISLERLVALKVLHPQLTVDPKFIENFKAEAQKLAQVEHPNVVSVYEINEVEGRLFIAMRYLPGGSLADRIARGALDLEEALKIVREVAAGLTAGHEKGIIHRDVKPANIIFDDKGHAVVTDFCVARAVHLSTIGTASVSGGMVGTPYYRPPELWRGKPKPSPATDVYSLGCVLYEILTGEVLFTGETPDQVMTNHVLEDAKILMKSSKVELPLTIQPVLEKTLSKDPSERYQSMDALVQALTQSQERQPTSLKVTKPKAPDQAVQHTAAEEKPTRGQKPSSQRDGEASISKPVSNETHVKRENAAVTGGKKAGFPKWLVLGAIGLVAASILIGIWIAGNKPAQEAPVAEQPSEEEREADEPAEKDYQAGDQMTNNQDGAEMVYVPEGEFVMGSEEDGAYYDESHVHSVTLDAYWIYKHEVTNAQYAEFVEDTGYMTDAEDKGWSYVYKGGSWEQTTGVYWTEPQGPGSDVDGLGNYPVIHVSWNDAQAYCEWAGGRLPTEAEWEKAARGEDGLKFPWGDTSVTGSKANYCDTNCTNDWKDSSQDDDYEQTAPVGSFPDGASPYGALDMAGNVWEWVGDWYDEDYYDSSPGSNPTGPSSGDYRVLRGGSWHNYEWHLRASERGRRNPDDALLNFGFRCFRSP